MQGLWPKPASLVTVTTQNFSQYSVVLMTLARIRKMYMDSTMENLLLEHLHIKKSSLKTVVVSCWSQPCLSSAVKLIFVTIAHYWMDVRIIFGWADGSSCFSSIQMFNRNHGLGHFRTGYCSVLIHSWVFLAVYFGSLSCWNCNWDQTFGSKFLFRMKQLIELNQPINELQFSFLQILR